MGSPPKGRALGIDEVVSLDYGRIARDLEGFIRAMVEDSGAKGVVVGVSGGVDSATVLALAARAVGRERTLALIMPDPRVTPQMDVDDAKRLVESLGVAWNLINIAPIVDVYTSSIPIYEDDERDRLSVGNLRARIRMNILYYYANKKNYLVAGTGDRSEILIGYFTKYGDGAVDMLPIGVLYKSQVRRLALELGIPESIALKPSSPRLWPGHEAEKELGITYQVIDTVLYARFDLGLEWGEIPEAAKVDPVVVERIRALHESSRHKREPPPMPPLEVVYGARG